MSPSRDNTTPPAASLLEPCVLADLSWPEDVRFCADQDWLIFLDLRRDRYWAISRNQSQSRIAAKLRRGGLAGPRPPMRPIRLSWSTFARHMPDWIVYADAARWARAVEKSRNLAQALAWIRARKAAHAAAGAQQRSPKDVAQTLRAAEAMRLWIPHRYICLFDALAHGRFLLQKGIDVDLVFGVRGRPFAAHCWLELNGAIIDAGQEDCASFAEIARA
jgi:hypothetical protein